MELTMDVVQKVRENPKAWGRMLKEERDELARLSEEQRPQREAEQRKKEQDEHYTRVAENKLWEASYHYIMYQRALEKLRRMRDYSISVGVDYERKGRYGVRVQGGGFGDKMADSVGDIVDQEKVVDRCWGDYLKALYITIMLIKSCTELTKKQRMMLIEMYVVHYPDRLKKKEDMGHRVGVAHPWKVSERALISFGRWYDSQY